MSEEGTQVQPVEQPVVPQQPSPPPPAAPATPAPTRVADLRRGLTEGLRTQINIDPETGKHDLKDESGKFVSEAPQEGDEGAPPEEAPSEGEPVAAGEEAPAVIPEMVEVEIPEGHWLRKDRGFEKFPPVPAEFVDSLKGVLADPVRRSEVREATERAQQYADQLQEAATVAEYWQERAAFFATNPEIALRVEQIKESMGEEEARRYIGGLMQEDSEVLAQKVYETRQAAQQETVNRDAAVFVTYARKDLGNLYPNSTPQQIDNIIEMYGRAVHAGQVPRVHRDTMREFAGSILGTPSSAPQKEKAPETFTKEQMEEAVRKAREEAASRASSNPLGSISPGSVSAPNANPNAVPENQQPSVPNIREHRRNLRRM
jgi:hypothetical protein